MDGAVSGVVAAAAAIPLLCISNFHSISTAFLYTKHIHCVVWCCDPIRFDPDCYRAIPVVLAWPNAGFCFNSDKTILRRAIAKRWKLLRLCFETCFFSSLICTMPSSSSSAVLFFFGRAVSLMVQSHHRLTIKINKYQSGICTQKLDSFPWNERFAFGPSFFHLYLRPLLTLSHGDHIGH